MVDSSISPGADTAASPPRKRSSSISSLSEVDEASSVSSSGSHNFSTPPRNKQRSNNEQKWTPPPLHTASTPLVTVLSSYSVSSSAVAPFLPIATPVLRTGIVQHPSKHEASLSSKEIPQTKTMASITNTTKDAKKASNTITPPDSPMTNDDSLSPAPPPTATLPFQPSSSSPTAIPYVSLHRGLQRKHSVTSIDAWNRLTLTLHGRDKVTKILQYLARLYVWWLKSNSCNSTSIAQWKHIQQTLTLARKAFRLGRGVGETPKMIQTVRSAYNHSSILPAIKSAGLWGFWMHDHLAFLTTLGVLQKKREWSKWAIRSYWASAVAGLILNWRAYWDHRQSVLGPLCRTRKTADDTTEDGDGDDNDRMRSQAEQKQFTLLLALVKSVCDVLVHSNNGGVDLWQRYRGRKMHEGLHCILGVTSAATVVYNNYPDYTP